MPDRKCFFAYGEKTDGGISHWLFNECATVEACADCSFIADYACDFPVGTDLTCDRRLCEKHRKNVAPEIDYCLNHFEQWREFVEKNGVEKVLKNLVPYEWATKQKGGAK